MLTLETHTSTSRPRPPTGSAALRMLQTFVWLLALLPARLVLGPIGAFGSPASLVGVAAFTFWATGALRPHVLPRTVWPVRVAFCALWIPVLVSYAVMHLHPRALDEVNGSDRVLLFLIVWSGIGLLAAEGLRDGGEAIRLVWTVVCAGAVIAAVATLQGLAGIDLTTLTVRIPGLSVAGELESVLGRSGFRRPAGTATHPIELGCVLATVLGPALALSIYWRDRPRILSQLAVALIALGIPITLSRSAIIGTVLALGVWFLVVGSDVRRRTALMVAGFGCVIFVVTPGLIGTLSGWFRAVGTDQSVATRTNDYAAVAHYIRSSPFVGRGPGTFLPRFRILDNQWLATLIEVGLFGLIGLMLLFLIPIALNLEVLRRHPRIGLGRVLAATMAGAFVIGAFSAAFYDALSYPMYPGLLSILIGVSGVMWSTVRRPPSWRRHE